MYALEKFWWDAVPDSEEAEKVHETLFRHVQSVDEEQRALAELNLQNCALYTNRRSPEITWGSSGHEYSNHGPVDIRHENLLAGGVNTATALIGKMRPKATPVPREATWGVEKQAHNLDLYLSTQFAEQQAYTKMQRAFNDACWATIGCLFVGLDQDNELYTERCFPDEIVVDQRECLSEAEPIQVHRRRPISKVVLKSLYPEFAEEIDRAGTTGRYTSYRTPTSEKVIVIESWQLALPGQECGKHSIVIENATLVYEDYDRDVFPFIFLRWTTLPFGFHGKSQVEEGAPYQYRHMELNRVIRISQDLMCNPRIFVDGSSKVKVSQIDNEIAKVYQYRGKLPVAQVWPAVSPELYQQRDSNIAAYYEAIGLSRMSTTGQLADGVRLDSSKALREANLGQSERFQVQSQMLEDAYLQLAHHYIALATIRSKNRTSPDDPSLRTIEDDIDWDVLGQPGIKYTLRLQASSISNLSTAAREDQLNEWASNGRITTEQYRGMSDHPDLEEEESLQEAGENDIRATIEDLDNGLQPQPDPLQNLVLGIPKVQMTYLKRKRQHGVSEEILQDYRDWLAEAQAVLDGLQEPVEMTPQDSTENLQAPVGPDGIPLPAQFQGQ